MQHTRCASLRYDVLRGGEHGFSCIRKRVEVEHVRTTGDLSAVRCNGVMVEEDPEVVQIVRERVPRVDARLAVTETLGGWRLLCSH